jgi:hypothetical protein
MKMNDNRGHGRTQAADENSERQAANDPDEELFPTKVSGGFRQVGQAQVLKRSVAKKTAQFHRRENNKRLEERIADECAGHRKRLVQPEEQCNTHGRKGVKAIDGRNADENSQEYGGGGVEWVELLGQQKSCDLPCFRLESSNHHAPRKRNAKDQRQTRTVSRTGFILDRAWPSS